MHISDPEPALRQQEAKSDNSKRNKILIGVGVGILLVGGAAVGVAMAMKKKSTSSQFISDASTDPKGDADGYIGKYGTGYLAPPDAEAVVAALHPFGAAAPLVAALPAAIDWRTDSAVSTPVKNQGGCGSCWAFAAAENMEASYGLKYGKQIQLSPQQMVDCDLKNGGCNGGWMMTAWTQYFKPNARAYALTESQYPYAMMSPNGKQRNTCSVDDSKGPVMVTSATNIAGSQTYSAAVEQTVMAYLAQNGPASIAVNADGWGGYRSGVATTASLRCTTAINHGVLLVGYGTDNGQDYWIIRNSWSSSWGEGGYMRLARGANTCCVLCAVMGVTVAATGNNAPNPAPTNPPANTNKLTANSVLSAGQQITSPDGNTVLKMQTDGNIVLFRTIFNAINTLSPVWSSNTFGANYKLKMQTDCNLVALNSNNQPVWASNTYNPSLGCANVQLVVNNDNTAAVVNNGVVLWATNGVTPNTPSTRPPVRPATTRPPFPTTKSPFTPKPPVNSLTVVGLGCWTDSSTRQLPTRLSGASNAVMKDCAWLAYNQGKTYFGLQYGGECWGGNDDPRKLGPSNQCTMKCQGDATQTCGGPWANTVYKITVTAALAPADKVVAPFEVPVQAFNVDTDCTFYKGAPSYCWRCSNNVAGSEAMECRDATVLDLSRDLDLGTGNTVHPALCPKGRTAAEVCGKGGQLAPFEPEP